MQSRSVRSANIDVRGSIEQEALREVTKRGNPRSRSSTTRPQAGSRTLAADLRSVSRFRTPVSCLDFLSVVLPVDDDTLDCRTTSGSLHPCCMETTSRHCLAASSRVKPKPILLARDLPPEAERIGRCLPVAIPSRGSRDFTRGLCRAWNACRMARGEPVGDRCARDLDEGLLRTPVRRRTRRCRAASRSV